METVCLQAETGSKSQSALGCPACRGCAGAQVKGSEAEKLHISIPPASPGTNPPVSSSQTPLQAPRWPQRRFSSQDPAAWDKWARWGVSRHPSAALLLLHLHSSYLFSMDDRSKPRAPANSTPKVPTKTRGRPAVFPQNTSAPTRPARVHT